MPSGAAFERNDASLIHCALLLLSVGREVVSAQNSSIESVFGPTDDSIIIRQCGHCGPVLSHGLAVFCDLPSASEILIIVHHGGLYTAHVSTSEHHFVAVEVILVTRQRTRYAHGAASVAVHVVVVVVVVATKIVLHSLAAIHQEIVVRVVKARAVIVVDVLLWRIIVDEEVVVDLAPLHDHGWLTRAHRGE